MAVKRFLGKIFYPVMFQGDADELLEKAVVVNNKQKEVPVFQKSAAPCEEMRWSVSRTLCGEDSELCIGSVYEAQRREVFFWPKNNKGLYFCPRTGSRVPIALTGLRYVLFETHVAFIEMDVELTGLPLEDVMNAAYFLCEPKDEKNHFEYEDRVFDPETRQVSSKPVSFSLLEWFLKCAEYLPDCRNFENRPLASTISKPLLYGYYLLDEYPPEFERTAYNIAQNYKLSYKGPEDGFHSHVLKVFENSYWCASYNGAVNVSLEVKDQVTNNFFDSAFTYKWASEYLLLFLLTIHQKFAVQKYLDEMGDLTCPRYDYARMKVLLEQGEAMLEKCALLQNRCFFQLPSRVEHVNRVFSFFQWSQDIPGYTASLNEGVETSIRVCKSYVTRIKNIEDYEKTIKSTQNEMYVALITASITCLTFFHSSYSTILAMLEGRFGEIAFSAVVVTGTFLATISTAVYKLFEQREKIKDLRKKIGQLKERVITL